jgi:hypothetical protein
MNNEPVAWINLDRFKDEALYLADCVSENKVDNMGITTPLYTHPAKEELDTRSYLLGRYDSTKTLTDEEIKEVWMNRPANTAEGVIDFARAILRKAQEK